MSWDQNYSIESLKNLLEKLTGKEANEVLINELKKQGIEIVKSEQTILEEDDMFFGPLKGMKITLSDGRVFEHKLVEKQTSGGNYGNNIYVWKEKNEKVNIEYTDLDEDESYSAEEWEKMVSLQFGEDDLEERGISQKRLNRW